MSAQTLHPSMTPRVRRRWRAVLFFVVLAMSLQLYLSNNQFSWLYHNDESSKVSQVVDAWRNFNHPPLLLTLADGFSRLTGGHDDAQSVVQVGRTISACALALGNALLVDMAIVWGGVITACALAVVLWVQPDLFEIAHYFKEDSLLLFGLAATFWARAYYGVAPGRRRAVLLGLALAVLAGSKYVGWFWVVLLVGETLWRHWPAQRRTLEWAGGAFGLATLAIYWPALWHFSTFCAATHLETKLLFAGDYGTGHSVPHLLYWRELVQSIPWPVLLFGVGAFALTGRERRPQGSLLMVISSLVLLIGLSFTAKYSDRYELPVIYLLIYVVMMGASLTGSRRGAHRWWPWLSLSQIWAVVVALWMVTHTTGEAARRAWGFTFDSRAVVQRYLADNYRGNLFLVEDEWARVDVTPRTGRWMSSWFGADLGSLDALRRQGVTHVLVSFDVSHRFLDDSVAQFDQADFVRRREFYQRLFREGRIELFLPSHAPKTLQPGLTLVDIRFLNPKKDSKFKPW